MNGEGNECVCFSFLCAKIQEAHLNPNDSERQLIKLSPRKHAHKIALSHFSWVEFLLQSSACCNSCICSVFVNWRGLQTAPGAGREEVSKGESLSSSSLKVRMIGSAATSDDGCHSD